MSELLEIKWTAELEDELRVWIRDFAQLPAVEIAQFETKEKLSHAMQARAVRTNRAIGALKALLGRHSTPGMDSEVVAAVDDLRRKWWKTAPATKQTELL